MTDNNQQLDEQHLFAKQPNTSAMVSDNYDHGQILVTAQLTPLHQLTLQKVDVNYPKLQLGIASVILGLITLLITLLIFIIPPIGWLIKSIISIITMVLASGVIRLIYLKACQVEFGAFANEFVMRSGLFWISTTALPYTRLQHVNLSQGPLERKFNLITLKCYSAGSGEAEIDLPGLNAKYAEHLRQHLLQQAAEIQQTETAQQANAYASSTPIKPPIDKSPTIEKNSVEANKVDVRSIPRSDDKLADNHHHE